MTERKDFPAGWLNSDQYRPEQHLSMARKNSTSNDYLRVAERLVWFVREQRQMIAAGIATCSFVIQTKTLAVDIQAGYATCETYIRDCLGNESTDIGTETIKDFGDFPEKAATKSKGRALASLGYGTQFSPELDEGERIVDAPVERKTTLAEDCAVLGHKLLMNEKAYHVVVQSYTHNGKINWQNVKSVLETKLAEQSLHNGQKAS